MPVNVPGAAGGGGLAVDTGVGLSVGRGVEVGVGLGVGLADGVGLTDVGEIGDDDKLVVAKPVGDTSRVGLSELPEPAAVRGPVAVQALAPSGRTITITVRAAALARRAAFAPKAAIAREACMTIHMTPTCWHAVRTDAARRETPRWRA